MENLENEKESVKLMRSHMDISRISNMENQSRLHLMDKQEEMKFFLREMALLDSQKSEYYYIIPFKWICKWDRYITDKTDEFPPKVDNSELVDSELVILQGLVENVDFIVLSKSLAYFFHDTYTGSRRIKTKYRHIYSNCIENCNKHNLWELLEVYKFDYLIKVNPADDEEDRARRDRGCFIFSWC